MAISKKMEDAINAQINAEFYSAYLYLAMSCQAADMKLKGLANWFNIQYQEEVAHAMGFLNYLNERGGRVLLTTIDAPPTQWDSPVAMFENTCEHEAKVTAMINDLAALAFEQKDFAASQFLNWYVKEQVEEEATADEILGELRLAADNPSATLMLDRELGARVFVAPVIG
ncbi:MAG: ferritin [Planctomycetia bacterium]|nr:ferritin [Planctomycetia bacterium]